MLIAFCGKAGAGKDTAAAALIRRGFKKIAFADPLKEGVAAMLGIERSLLEDRVYKETVLPGIGKSPREMMQTVGTEWGRKLVHENVWVNLAMARAAKHENVVFTDCRFDNEALAVHEAGGVVIQIEREGVAPVAAHASERGISLPLIDQFLINSAKTEQRFIDDVGSAYDKGLLFTRRQA